MKNLKVYDENDYEMLQIAHEDASWGRVRDDGRVLDVEIATDDEYMETCIDLCEAGFVLVNNRCVKR